MGLSSADRVIERRLEEKEKKERRGLFLPRDYIPPEAPDPRDTQLHCVRCGYQVMTPGNACPCCGARD